MKSTILLILLTLFFVFLSSCAGPEDTPTGLMETSETPPDDPYIPSTPNPDNSGVTDADVKDLYIAVGGRCFYKPRYNSEGKQLFHNIPVIGTSKQEAQDNYNSACRTQAFAASGDYDTSSSSYVEELQVYSCDIKDKSILEVCKRIFEESKKRT